MAGKGRRREKLTAVPTRRPANGTAVPAPSERALNLGHIAEDLRPLAVRTSELAFLAENPLDHPDKEIDEMRALLKRWGQVMPLVINTRPVPWVVVGGNRRLRAMLAESLEWVAVLKLDLAPEDEATLAVELNSSQGHVWNRDLLKKAMHRIGSVSLGEVRDAMMARLAEAQRLIAKGTSTPQSAQSPQPSAEPMTCPKCAYQWTPAA